MLDSHTHLDIVGTDPVGQIAAAARSAWTGWCRSASTSSPRGGACGWPSEHPGVLATVALHPNDAPRLADLDEALREIEALAAHPRVRAIGETGLDHFRTGEDGRAVQERSFRAHIAIAKRYDRTLMIHDRDAHADVLRVLDEEGAPDRVVMHCFSGDAEFAVECVKRGFLLSFAGTVTFANARDAARGGGADPARVDAGRDRRAVPDPDALPGPAQRLLPDPADRTGAGRGRPAPTWPTLCAAISANGERVFGPWR